MASWTPRQWAYAAVLAGLVTGTFGIVMNDEQEQVVALHNLSQGSFLIEDRPEWIYPKVAGNLTKAYRFPGPEPVGSPLLNTVALPLILVLRVADALAPLGIWLAAAATGLGWGPVAPGLRGSRGKAVVLGLFAVLAAGFRTNEIDVATYAPLLALQFANLLALGIGAGFLAAAVQRHVTGPAVPIATAAALMGPMLFWGAHIKYTMFAMALTAIALWLAGEAPSRRRAMGLGVVAAFAIWNNIGPGLVVAGGVGLLLLVETLRHGRDKEAWKRLGLGTVAGAFGLTAWGVGNAIISGNPLIPTKIVMENRNVESAGYDNGDGLLQKIWGLMVDETRWRGPLDLGLDILDVWTVGSRLEGPALGVLLISPLFVLALWTVLRTGWWRRADIAVALTFLFLQVALFSNRVVIQGWGWDARLVAPVIPALALVAAPGIHAVTRGMELLDVRRTRLVTVLWAAALVGAVLAVSLLRILPYGMNDSDLVRGLLRILIGSTVFLASLAWAGARFSLLPVRGARAIAIGLLLAVPVIWTCVAAMASPSALPSEDGGTAVGFIPLVDHGWHQALGHLFPRYPMPVVYVNNETVFHPSFGNCQQVPNPCPWTLQQV